MMNEDAALRVMNRVKAAIEVQRDRLDLMQEAELAYNVTPPEGSERLIRDPELFANVETVTPRVVSKNPRVVAKARRGVDQQLFSTSQQNEKSVSALLENWMTKAGLQELNQRAERAALIQGTTLYNICWHRDEVKKTRYVMGADGMPFVDPQSDPDSPKYLTEQYSILSYNDPQVDIVPVENIFIDPEANDISRAQWMVLRFRTTIQELEDNDRYSDLEDLVPGQTESSDLSEYRVGTDAATMNNRTQNTKDESVDWVIVYEMFEKTKDGVKQVSVCQDKVIEERTMPYQFNSFPLVPLYDIRRHNSFWGIGEYEPVRSYQNLLDTLTSLDLENRMKLNDPKPVTRGEVDDAEVLGENTVIHLIGPNDSVDYLQVPDITATIGAAKSEVRSVIQNALGTYDIARTGGESATATEITTVNEQSNVRFRHKLENFEMAQKDLLTKALAMYQQYSVEPIYLEDGTELKPAQIQGEFTIEIESGSSRPVNVQMEREDAMAVYELVRPLFQQDTQYQTELIKWMLEKWDNPELVINAIDEATRANELAEQQLAGTEALQGPGAEQSLGAAEQYASPAQAMAF
jgi:hypothetical protein